MKIFKFYALLFALLAFSCDGILTIDYSKWMHSDNGIYKYRKAIATDVIEKRHYFIGRSEDFLLQTLGKPDARGFQQGNNCFYKLSQTSNREKRIHHNQYLVFWYNPKGDIVSMEIVRI